jgi:hypothetical protein
MTKRPRDIPPALRGRRPQGGAPQENSDQALRFGLEFSDGRKATSVGDRVSLEEEPNGPVLLGAGGVGGRSCWDQ